MQHPLTKSPIFKTKIGDFVVCGRVLERKGSLQTGPLYTSPAKAFVQFLLFALSLCHSHFQQARIRGHIQLSEYGCSQLHSDPGRQPSTALGPDAPP